MFSRLLTLFWLLKACLCLRFPQFRYSEEDYQPPVSSANCTERWFDQRIDHFSSVVPPGGELTFKERYYVCDQYWSPLELKRGPIFFYTGNEGDVTLYINNTGLMWETAEKMGALLIFAEHRYFGESMPFGDDSINQLAYLSSEQALADYSSLILSLQKSLSRDDHVYLPVIAFGGSYGGMLASYLRIKYPHVVDGAISASAPVLSFLGETPEVDPSAFNRIVTQDASAVGGSSDACSANVQATWAYIDALIQTSEGRVELASLLSLCSVPDASEALVISNYISTAWAYMAMGDFPYPSSYLLMGNGMLPAWPVQVACDDLADPSLASDVTRLLPAHALAIGVYYNNSGDQTCFAYNGYVNEETDIDNYLWNYLYCTELLMPSSSLGGANDMFWYYPFSMEATSEWCFETFGILPRPDWASIYYGGHRLQYSSNIVYSNGNLDPWSGTGVTKNISVANDVIAIMIEDGAHHLDLMFSRPEYDPESVVSARQLEVSMISKWVAAAWRKNAEISLSWV